MYMNRGLSASKWRKEFRKEKPQWLALTTKLLEDRIRRDGRERYIREQIEGSRDPQLAEQQIQALVNGDPLGFLASTTEGSTGWLFTVAENIGLLKTLGIYEEALLEAFMGTRTNNAAWSVKQLLVLFSEMNPDRLAALRPSRWARVSACIAASPDPSEAVVYAGCLGREAWNARHGSQPGLRKRIPTQPCMSRQFPAMMFGGTNPTATKTSLSCGQEAHGDFGWVFRNCANCQSGTATRSASATRRRRAKQIRKDGEAWQALHGTAKTATWRGSCSATRLASNSRCALVDARSAPRRTR